ncbi:MAG: hypothetical protein AB1806_14395 [Acidobacteriota bacterium]
MRRFHFPSGRVPRALVLGAAAAASVAALGCGKKGPPLAPLVTLPNRITDLAARRLGDTIYVTFTVPATNIDGTAPADLRRVEVYAYTALEAAEGRDVKRTTLVATIPVKAPPKPPETEAEDEPPRVDEAVGEPGVDQGALVAIVETVSDELRVPLPPDPKAPKPKSVVRPAPEFATTLPLPLPEPEPARFYVAVGVNRKGKKGPFSPRPAAFLHAAPPAPEAPLVSVTEPSVVLEWSRPAGLRRPYLDPDAGARREVLLFGWFVTLPVPPRLTSTFTGLPRQPAITYNVYRVPAPAATSPIETPPPRPGLVSAPVPLGERPTEGLTFRDPIGQWGVEQCYAVRTVQTVESVAIESELSPIACVVPTDSFAPEAPTALAAVASQGAISLIWERVQASDLAGYLVFRGPAPDGPLEPLFETPIRETTYRDATAATGARYVYEVVAVDAAATPNRSVPSNRVVEAAR